MSEYQYYEFAAIDRPLTTAEMARLRQVSTRGRISTSGFVNHYEWGGLKADPSEWMRRYFDAFVYTANWGSCRLALRLPLANFCKTELTPFAAGHALTIEASGEYWIVDWSLDDSENHDRFAVEEGSGWMSRLAPLREELLSGDLRPLYLGWLASAGRLDDDALEPEVPPGLAELSPPQQALAEFIEVDPDLLAVAAAGSAQAVNNDSAHCADIDAWLAGWSHGDMAAVLKLIAQGQSREAERRVRADHAAWSQARRSTRTPSTARRVVKQLRELAPSARGLRLEREEEARTAVEAERRRQRESALRLLMADVDNQWATVDALATRGSAYAYQQAVQVVKDLADGYALTANHKVFDRALRRLLVRHATRGALLRRLTEAGLWSG